ncbi:hypothetical protein SERLA73DRAFT_184950 [Serpula lacrymans var. lacrymans S7.3]|uniref:SnoaL-like domain-containing protein n=2 Tax=Serpula lacrymans var. lacrymans TaxID=341189 RepID=F8Q3T4_SERL3|nr:uncharacterized protein SERLADRAFT_473138 [Serpula lacrymans var. lacrymans S7.9]EGN96790.1 hypothetical protein SERLA73DRAFT_184950 [Serpula lacrymans var. lacrymans S7.3]EGO22389.1 hypothetical protein SERLADRAFT_473138 [Serpula lacrymans var. lacrymans S7.9]
MISRVELLHAAQALCDDFASKKDIDTLLSHFSTTHQCTLVEHGEPFLAPFLGRPFNGISGALMYFDLINKHLSYENMRFSEYVVDVEARKVSVKGKAKFTWIETDESWDETFAYMLDSDDELKITDYQVWADSGAAYLASKGELGRSKG